MATIESRRHITGVVVSAGKMINTVKVRIPKQVWNKRLQKYYSEPKTLLVSDPTNSTREGDVVALESGRRISRNVRHVVAGVVAPMGPPMHDRAPVPSTVERLAAVEAKRAAKDIRQAARGRWPAIVRVREREAKGAAGVEEAEVKPAVSLERFVKAVRRRKDDSPELRKALLLDFLRVANYRVLQGELPLESQSSALNEARGKLLFQVTKLTEQLTAGTSKRTGSPLSLAEQEQLSKRKLELNTEVAQLERSLNHLRSYLREVAPGDRKRRGELKRDWVEWFDLVGALHLNAWEQNVAALDLFGVNTVKKASELELDDVLARAGLASAAPAVPATATIPAAEAAAEAVGAAPLADEATPVVEAAVEEASIRASEIQEQTLATEAATESLDDLAIDKEPLASTEATSSFEEAALEAQREEAEALVSGEKELPPTGQEPGTGPPELQQQEAVRKAQDAWEKGLENEAQIEEERKAAKEEGIDAEPKKPAEEKKSGGFWGLFGKR